MHSSHISSRRVEMATEETKSARVPMRYHYFPDVPRLFDIAPAVYYLRELGAVGVTTNFVAR